MTQPKCRDCHTEIKERPQQSGDLFWGKKKDGKPLLMEARPHLIYCTGRPKKGAGAAQSGSNRGSAPGKGGNKGQEVAANPAAEDAVRALVALDIKVTEARRLVDGVKATDFQGIMVEALARRG